MSISPLATRMWSRDSFDVSRAEAGQKKGKVIEGYQITCPPDYTDLQVSSIVGIPEIGDQYSDNPAMLMINRNFQRMGPIYWIAMVTYEGDYPKLNRPEIRWQNSKVTEPIDEDFDGRAIVTANSEPIEGITKEISDAVQTIKRNYLTIDIPAIHSYLDSVSSDSFAGFGAGISRLTDYQAEAVWGNETIDHWIVTATISHRFPYNTTAEKAWYARTRHEGYYEKSNGIIIRAADDHQEPMTSPVLLKADGTRETISANAHFLEFKRYGILSYNALGLLD